MRSRRRASRRSPQTLAGAAEMTARSRLLTKKARVGRRVVLARFTPDRIPAGEDRRTGRGYQGKDALEDFKAPRPHPILPPSPPSFSAACPPYSAPAPPLLLGTTIFRYDRALCMPPPRSILLCPSSSEKVF
jgi:hypothetical protein